MNRPLIGLCGLLLVSLVNACASSGGNPEAKIQTLGFLDDYAQLAPGRAGQANLIYISDEADFSGYTAILVEPVVPLALTTGGEPSAESKERASTLDAGLRREFALAFDLADEAGPGVLRMRSALAVESDSHLHLEVEILDGASDQRVVAAVDRRVFTTAGADDPLEEWPVIIRNRLATFRQFDAAVRAREEAEEQEPIR